MRSRICFLLVTAFTTAAETRPDGVVLDTTRSPRAVLHGVPVSAVTITEGFWQPRIRAVAEVSLPSLLQIFEERGWIDNFRRISGRKDVPRRGPLYTDSDVYKWLEAVAFLVQSRPDSPVRKSAEAVIDEIAAAQEPGGYINTFFSRENRDQRHKNMRHGHELYCLGHLIQAGIAWQRATGESKLFSISRRMADYVASNFGQDKAPAFEGHPEIELALIELSRVTRDRKYLETAGYFLGGDARNLSGIPPRDLVYLFTGKPFTDRSRMEGHAVRAAYACSGAADYFLETGDERYRKTLAALWTDMTGRKQYLTGGIGSRASGEAFGEPYELPNQQAYTESCAAIATMFWNWRMAQAEPDGKYIDNLERALYNGANSGLSLTGNLYCYRNPLELVGNPEDRIRNPFYDTACCPPNLQRILTSLPGYFYSTSKAGLWVHLFDNNGLDWRLEDGTPIRVTQSTKYPWNGRIEIAVDPKKPTAFTLYVRRPAWADGTRLTVAGAASAAEPRNGYFAIRRTWKRGDVVTLDIPVAPRLTVSNPYVRENLGKVAVERGPLIYCMEGLDQPTGTTVFDWALNLRGDRPAFVEEWKSDLLGGVTVLRHVGSKIPTAGSGSDLYQAFRRNPAPGESATVTLIPYYTFHNRDITSMQVWIPYRIGAAGAREQ